MPRRFALLGLSLLTCCTTGNPTTGTGGKPKASPVASTVAVASPSPGTQVTAATGHVFDLNGKPAADVPVKAYIIGNNGGNVVSNNGGGYHVLEAALETRTAADGSFTLKGDPKQAYNLEAVQSDELKAFGGNLLLDKAVELHLNYTGSISGKVAAPGAPTVKDFEGVDVFIPGTSYAAKADHAGNYNIANVPVGTFELVASKTGLGRASAPGVAVAPKQKTQAPELDLSAQAPTLTSVEPPAGAPGATLTLKGAHFGTDAAKAVQVTIGGVVVAAPRRKDDGTIEIEVPEAAASGDVVVAVEGVASTPLPFYVIKSLAVASSAGTLLVGATQQLSASGTGFDGKPVPDVKASWKSDGPAVTVDAKGLVTAAAVGKATVTATLGTLTASTAFEVVASQAKVGPFAAGALTGPGRMASGADGTLYLLDGGKVVKIPPGGSPVDLVGSGKLTSPEGIALDHASRLIVVDTGANALKAVAFDGTVSDLGAQNLSFPRDAAVSSGGNIYVADDINYRVVTHTSFNTEKTCVAFDKGGLTTERLRGMAIGSDDTLYLCDQNRIMAISAAGESSVLAGGPDFDFKDGVGTAARFNKPADVLPDGNGGLYVADAGNNAIRRIELATGAVTTVAGDGTAGDADGLGKAARFSFPDGLALVNGTLVVADRDNAKLRAITFVTKP